MARYLLALFSSLFLLIGPVYATFEPATPVYDLITEATLQGALRDSDEQPANDPTLASRLAEISIASALRDTQRLRWELG